MNFENHSDQSVPAQRSAETLLGKIMENFVIAYISCPQDSGRNYLGGILLTDQRTRPLEFAFISPVKITTLQRIIHGRTLDEAITVDLVAKRLLTSAPKEPDIIFVDSDILLELQRLTTIPVAKLFRQDNSAGQPSTLSTIKFTTANGANADSAVGEVLSRLEPLVDLVEPFARMTEAIKEALKSVPTSPPSPASK